jgi:4-carboxymuconolactone decarboxylase
MAKQDALDSHTLSLVQLAAAVAQGYEPELRQRVSHAFVSKVPAEWVQEMLLQSILMVGYPRALVGFAAWEEVSRVAAPEVDEDSSYDNAAEWRRRGEHVCTQVYGENYTRLRDNVRRLHPALDAWMVTEGYGRTIGRTGLDLWRRELCVIAQTAVLDTPRQLHSHLRGALNAGATPEHIDAVLSVVNPLLALDQWTTVKHVWRRVREGSEAGS